MPILKGSLTYQRFRISDEVNLSMDAIIEKMRLFKFRALDSRGFDQESAGWCAYLNEYDHEKELEIKDILYDEKIVLTLRYDQMVLPKPLLKSLIKKSHKAYYDDHKRWPDRTIKKELEQAIVQDLRSRMIPKTKIIEAVWSLESRELRIFSRSKTLVERFLDLFKATFLQKAYERDFTHEAYFFLASKNQSSLLDGYSYTPLFKTSHVVDVV